MTGVPLLGVGLVMKFVAVLFVLVSVVLVLVILIQKGRGGGLSGAFGGGMAGGLLGSKTGDFLTWVTIVLVAIFLTLAVLMGRFFRPDDVGQFGAEGSVESSQPAPGAEAQPLDERTGSAPVDAQAEPATDANAAGG
ncbi:MAG: preprotein translocase subunit SecG [Sedimentisphaerales bacterium]|nr:preprotein translocase subunit SecG [Sedimentisphaerales bacterium]